MYWLYVGCQWKYNIDNNIYVYGFFHRQDCIVFTSTVQGNRKNNKQNSRIGEPLTFAMCADNSIVSQTKQNIWVQFGTPPVFKALRGADLEQNWGTIQKSNP